MLVQVSNLFEQSNTDEKAEGKKKEPILNFDTWMELEKFC